MNTGIQQVLEGFDALPDPEKHQAAVEILRRLAPANEGDLPETALVDAAEELFRTLDNEEAGDAKR